MTTVTRKHYNYPLTQDRCKFVHYYRNDDRPWSFGVRRWPYGFTIRGFSQTMTWVLWPSDGCERHHYEPREVAR